MSNDTVLARKWRPRQFSEVVGQEPVVRALSQALNSGRLHHAYLFTGTRGVGKTTLARIFAKALNCRHGLSSEPCNDDIAQAIDEGRFVDLIEIDAASKTKVEDTRELLDNVQYAPSVGRFKIYLIDEVHMLSTHSFNALLKTLEEPPEHVKFLLATTDPHKLPVTILSRCLQFHLRPMIPETLNQHLARVLTDEGIVFDSEAITLVSKMAQGSVRDALSLLDQAIILGGGQVGYGSTREMLGLASTAQIMTLLQAIADQQREAVLEQLKQWSEWGADFDRLQQQILTQLHELSMMQVFPSLAESALPEQKTLLTQVSAEQMQIWLQVALLAKEDMQIAPSAQMGFEILLMRLLHFRASVPSSADAIPRRVSSPTPTRAPIETPRVAPAIPAQVAVHPTAMPAVASTQAPIAVPTPTPAPAMDFSLLFDMVGAQKKTLTPPTPKSQPTVIVTANESVNLSSLAEMTAPFTATRDEVSTENDVVPDVIDAFDRAMDDVQVNSDASNDTSIDGMMNIGLNNRQIADTVNEPRNTNSLDLTTTLTTTTTTTSLTADLHAPRFTPYPIEQWQNQLAQWRLNPLQMSVAERCVRLQSNDPNQILLACPPAEAASFALMRDKLVQAITKAEPSAQVSWVEAWQDTWQTLQHHATAVSEQERLDAQTAIANNPLFMLTCQQFGLVAQWDRLIARTSPALVA